MRIPAAHCGGALDQQDQMFDGGCLASFVSQPGRAYLSTWVTGCHSRICCLMLLTCTKDFRTWFLV